MSYLKTFIQQDLLVLCFIKLLSLELKDFEIFAICFIASLFVSGRVRYGDAKAITQLIKARLKRSRRSTLLFAESTTGTSTDASRIALLSCNRSSMYDVTATGLPTPKKEVGGGHFIVNFGSNLFC